MDRWLYDEIPVVYKGTVTFVKGPGLGVQIKSSENQ